MNGHTVAKIREHVRRQMWANTLSGTDREKLARIQTLPLFEVAMHGRLAVFEKKPKKFVSNLPSLRKAA